MKKLLVSLAIILLTIPLRSQNFQWVHTTDLNINVFQRVRTGITINNSNELITCVMYESNTIWGFGDIIFRTMEKDGTVLDEVILYGEARPPSKIVTDENNNLYFYIQYQTDMTWWDNIIETYADDVNLALVKLDESFNIVWVQYQQESNSIYNRNHTVLVNGNTLLTSIQENDFTKILKMDLDGNVLMEIEQNNVSLLSSIDIDSDGNIYATGSCAENDATFNGVPWPPPDFYNLYLVKYDATGQPQWVKYFIDATCMFPLVKVRDQEHVYLSSTIITDMYLDSILVTGPPVQGYDFFLARLNSEGNVLWARDVPVTQSGSAGIDDNSEYMVVDQENNVYIAGMTKGSIDWGNDISTTTSTPYYNDILLWSYDADGEIQFAITAGGSYLDRGQTIAIDDMGEIFIGGAIYDTAAFGDLVIEKEWRSSFIARYGYGTTGLSFWNETQTVKISPNPVIDFVNIKSEYVLRGILIYNNLGQIIMIEEAANKTFQFNASDWIPGVYIIQIQTNSHSFIKKIVKN